MSHVKATVAGAARDTRGAHTSASRTSTTGQPETMGAGIKAVYWLLGIIVVGYAVSLVVRANGASTDWLDGWGTALYELVASVLVLIRAAVSPRDRRFCLALGTGMDLWAIGDFAMTYESIHNPNPPTRCSPTTSGSGFSRSPTWASCCSCARRSASSRPPTIWTASWSPSRAPRRSPRLAFGAIQHWVGDDSVMVAWNLI